MKKTSKQWLEETQLKIHLEIDVNNKQCGWDTNDFNYLFHNELITLNEFKDRLKKSIIICNIIEINNWLNEVKLKSELVTIQEFIHYYKDASRKELKACLKNCKGHSIIANNERDAIIALLA